MSVARTNDAFAVSVNGDPVREVAGVPVWPFPRATSQRFAIERALGDFAASADDDRVLLAPPALEAGDVGTLVQLLEMMALHAVDDEVLVLGVPRDLTDDSEHPWLVPGPLVHVIGGLPVFEVEGAHDGLPGSPEALRYVPVFAGSAELLRQLALESTGAVPSAHDATLLMGPQLRVLRGLACGGIRFSPDR